MFFFEKKTSKHVAVLFDTTQKKIMNVPWKGTILKDHFSTIILQGLLLLNALIPLKLLKATVAGRANSGGACDQAKMVAWS